MERVAWCFAAAIYLAIVHTFAIIGVLLFLKAKKDEEMSRLQNREKARGVRSA